MQVEANQFLFASPLPIQRACNLNLQKSSVVPLPTLVSSLTFSVYSAVFGPMRRCCTASCTCSCGLLFGSNILFC